MIKKKIDFEKLQKEIDDNYYQREYRGIYDTVLHLRHLLKFMKTPEMKKFGETEYGELQYLEQIRQKEKALDERLKELQFIRNLFK